MEPNVIEIRLDEKALTHVRKRLGEGRTLARGLLARPDLSLGVVSTYLPADTPVEELYDFDDGILPEPPPEEHMVVITPEGKTLRSYRIPTVDDARLALVTDFLAQGTNRVCVFERTLALASDPWIDKVDSGILFHGSDVYHLLSVIDLETPERLPDKLRTAKSWQWSGVMSSLPASSPLPPHRTVIGGGFLKTLAARAEKILVEAYDQEGFLVWSKP